MNIDIQRSFQQLGRTEVNYLTGLHAEIMQGARRGIAYTADQNNKVLAKGILSNSLNNSLDINGSGFKFDITTLTSIIQGPIHQKFYTLGKKNGKQRTIDDCMPVSIGGGTNPYAEEMTRVKMFQDGVNFENATVNNNTHQLQTSNIGTVPFTFKVQTWGMSTSYNILAQMQSGSTGLYDLISETEKSRKRNWDLGLQKLAFLGLDNNPNFTGLLNNSQITPDLTTLVSKFKIMNSSQLSDAMSKIVASYLAGNNNTEMPNKFAIALDDWAGLGIPFDSTQPYPKTRIEYLQDMFKQITNDDTAEIYPLAYCDINYNNLGINRYVMYRSEPETLELHIPINYTPLFGQNTMDGFNFINAAIGRYSPVVIYRPQEVRYFDF